MRKRLCLSVLMCFFILLISQVSCFAEETSEDEKDSAWYENELKQVKERMKYKKAKRLRARTDAEKRQLEKERPDKINIIDDTEPPKRPTSEDLPNKHVKEISRANTDDDKLAAILEYAVAKYTVAYESYNIAKQSEDQQVRKLIPKYLRSYREAAADLLTLLRDNDLYEPQEPKNIARKFNDQMRDEDKEIHETSQGDGLSADKLENIKKAMKKNNTTAVVDYVDKYYKNNKNKDYAKKMRKKDKLSNEEIDEEGPTTTTATCQCDDPAKVFEDLENRYTKLLQYYQIKRTIPSPKFYHDRGEYVPSFEVYNMNLREKLAAEGLTEEDGKPMERREFNTCPSTLIAFLRHLNVPHENHILAPNPELENDRGFCGCNGKPRNECHCACCTYVNSLESDSENAPE